MCVCVWDGLGKGKENERVFLFSHSLPCPLLSVFPPLFLALSVSLFLISP